MRLSGGERRVVDGAPLDEQAQILLATALRLGRKRPEEVGVARARAELAFDAGVLAPRPRQMARIEDRTVGPFSLRLYVPPACAKQRDAPALLYIHGGGFVLGSVAAYDGVCRYLAVEAGCIVASLGYRLAPEHEFPAAVDDATAAFAWLSASARELGIDPARIAVGGDSAGGNLAAVVTQQQRARGGPMPAFQLLVYPATELSCSMPSHRLFASGFFLEATTVRWFLKNYLRGPEDIGDVRASPLLAQDFTGLPPAMVLTAGFDPLRDEGEAYVQKLEGARVPVIHRHDAGMFHGYLSAAGELGVARDALAHAARVLRNALALRPRSA